MPGTAHARGTGVGAPPRPEVVSPENMLEQVPVVACAGQETCMAEY